MNFSYCQWKNKYTSTTVLQKLQATFSFRPTIAENSKYTTKKIKVVTEKICISCRAYWLCLKHSFV